MLLGASFGAPLEASRGTPFGPSPAASLVSSLPVTPCRSASRRSRPGCHAVSTGAEAPRPGRDRTDGRSPGSRVAARHRLPGSLTQWPSGTGSPLTVAGAAAELERWFRTAFPLRSRVRDRRCGELTGSGRGLSMRGGGSYCTATTMVVGTLTRACVPELCRIAEEGMRREVSPHPMRAARPPFGGENHVARQSSG